MVPNAGEDICHLTLRAGGITNPISCQQRQLQTSRDLDHGMIARFFFTIEMTLQLGVNVFFAKDVDEPLSCFLCLLRALRVSVVIKSKWPIISTSQTNQSFRMLSQFFRRYRTLARLCMFWHAQLHQSDQATKVLIAGAITNQERKSDYRFWNPEFGFCILDSGMSWSFGFRT